MLASHELESRYSQCDSVPGVHFYEERIATVAFHCDAWFDAGWSENAVEATIILGKIPAAEGDEWFGSGHITRVGESYWKSVAPDARVLRYSKGRPDHGISDSDKNTNLRKTMAYEPLYTAVATATGGRDGHVESSDGIVKLDLSVPREMGGPANLVHRIPSNCLLPATLHVSPVRLVCGQPTTQKAQ